MTNSANFGIVIAITNSDIETAKTTTNGTLTDITRVPIVA